MADRVWKRAKGLYNHAMIPLMTSVAIAADASVTTNNNPILGTWTKAATGKYRWVSTDPFTGPAANTWVTATLQAATAVDLVPQITALSYANGILTIDVSLLAAAVATDPAAVCTLHIIGWIKDSGVTP